MADIADIKEYAWALALIGGLINIITFFTPTHSFFGLNIWMWGLVSSVGFMGYGGGVTFNTDPTALGVGIPMAVLILISGLGGIFLAVKVQKGDRDADDVCMIWMVLGLLGIVAPIVFLSVMSMSIYGMIPVSFGVIGSFIGGALLLAGGAVTKYR